MSLTWETARDALTAAGLQVSPLRDAGGGPYRTSQQLYGGFTTEQHGAVRHYPAPTFTIKAEADRYSAWHCYVTEGPAPTFDTLAEAVAFILGSFSILRFLYPRP